MGHPNLVTGVKVRAVLGMRGAGVLRWAEASDDRDNDTAGTSSGKDRPRTSNGEKRNGTRWRRHGEKCSTWNTLAGLRELPAVFWSLERLARAKMREDASGAIAGGF
jgi:hypothetical protein